jgi:hypothetical protein
MCSVWAGGTVGDTAGDTLGCRNYYAGLAAGSAANAATHCPHAGPFGGGVCGANTCNNFCELAVARCSTATLAAAGITGVTQPYTSLSDCTTACGSFTVGELLDASAYSANGPTQGNDLECREYHLSLAWAATGNQDPHCTHIGASSSVCTGAPQ